MSMYVYEVLWGHDRSRAHYKELYLDRLSALNKMEHLYGHREYAHKPYTRKMDNLLTEVYRYKNSNNRKFDWIFKIRRREVL